MKTDNLHGFYEIVEMEQSSKMNTNRRRNYRNYEKPQWQVEKEKIEREREEARLRAIEKTEDNFPTLGKIPVKNTVWGGKKFTELASDWKAADEERKAEEEKRKEQQKHDSFVMPRFNLQHHYVEPEDEENTVVHSTSPVVEEEDTWTTVDTTAKKYAQLVRREQRREERLRRMDAGEESEPSSEEDEEEDSCWNQVAPIGKSYN